MVAADRSRDTGLTVSLWEKGLIESELKYTIPNFCTSMDQSPVQQMLPHLASLQYLGAPTPSSPTLLFTILPRSACHVERARKVTSRAISVYISTMLESCRERCKQASDNLRERGQAKGFVLRRICGREFRRAIRSRLASIQERRYQKISAVSQLPWPSWVAGSWEGNTSCEDWLEGSITASKRTQYISVEVRKTSKS